MPPRRGLLTAVFIGIVVIGLLIAWILNGRGAEVASNGDRAPEFSVTLFDGTTFDLETHVDDDGRPLVLNLWASWCAPCRREIPELSQWAADHPEALVLGVAVEDVEAEARALADELSPGYGMGIGDTGFRAAYPSLGLPATYVIDGDGRIAVMINGVLTTEQLDASITAASD